MNCVFSSHLWLDFTIFDNLSQILADSRVNACACLSPETAILLEKPINLLNYSILAEEEDVEEYSKMELGLMVNDLLRERQQIMQLFQQVDGERRSLREHNVALLRHIFAKTDDETRKNQRFYSFFARVFGLNYEFMAFSQEKQRVLLEKSQQIIEKQRQELAELASKIEKLEKKLLKSRENLKQYLVTGKINPEELSSLGLSSHKLLLEPQQDLKNQIDLSQDWEKISLNSQNSNLILFNSKKTSLNPAVFAGKSLLNRNINNNNANYCNNASNLASGGGNSANNKLKLQETKNKIDKYFNKTRSPDVSAKKNLENASHLKTNDSGFVEKTEKTATKTEKTVEKTEKTVEKTEKTVEKTEKIEKNANKTEKIEKNEEKSAGKGIISQKMAPKIMNVAEIGKHLAGNRVPSQPKIHLKKNNLDNFNNNSTIIAKK